ncbi:aconitase family protein, partial [Streptomyces anthocyanicus]|uniref:aconitase family protein n=1 Tax=Streptomyces anthocyanicus TaxID=68174 RepID=UPI00364F7737
SNASAFTARVAIGCRADMTAALTAAIAAFSGSVHGGAAERAIKLVDEVGTPENAEAHVAALQSRGEPVMGFGHRVYRTEDPRMRHLRASVVELSEERGDRTGLDVLDAVAAAMRPRQRHGVAPNVDLYAGLSYRLLGLPDDVVVDHSVQTDWAGRPDALGLNEALEMDRNRERYAFLKWAEGVFDGVRVIPPGRGIVHQVNLEQLATVVAEGPDGSLVPDTVLGTDSHTTMVNGLGVLGWGVGGLEAEAQMLGLAQAIRIPPIVGVRLTGAISPGTSPTDVVLALTRRLREEDVQGLMVEFTGPGVDELSAPDRCTVANMAPEYGAMSAFFPVDEETLAYLRRTGRDEPAVTRVREYCREQRLLREAAGPVFGRTIAFDLSEVGPGLAGPSRPDQRISLGELPGSLAALCPEGPRSEGGVQDGDLVIAAITSCTSTSNPKAMLAAGLLAKRAVERGLRVPAHVKTS